MGDRLEGLEATVLQLAEQVRALERRLDALEGGAATAGWTAPSDTAPAAAVLPAARGSDFVTLLSFVGRSLIVLGGAYLLRALTEAGTLPQLGGVALGLAYAAVWLLAASRVAESRNANAFFHGLTASLVGFPLIWEATVRFGFLTPATSAVALTAFAGLALFVAGRGGLTGLGWVVTIASLAAASALVPATGEPVPYTLSALVLGLATLWLGYLRDWTALRWPAALVADALAAGVTFRALQHPPLDPPGVVVAVLLALVVGYLASTAIRTLARGRNVLPFEAAQLAVGLAIGLGGSVLVSRAQGMSATWLGVAAVGVGAAAYAVAFAFVDRRQGRGVNFYFYASLGVVSIIVGSGVLFGAPGLALVATLLGVGSTYAGRRLGRVVLAVHGAVYLAVAFVASGVAGAATQALFTSGGTTSMLGIAAPSIVLAALACTLADVSATQGWRLGARLPRVMCVVIAVWAGTGLVVAWAAWLLEHAVGRALDPGEMATVRTTGLSLAALVLAWVSRILVAREASWVVYPLLLVTGVGVALRDLGVSRPSLLVIALGAYGATLILAPRLLRQIDRSTPEPRPRPARDERPAAPESLLSPESEKVEV